MVLDRVDGDFRKLWSAINALQGESRAIATSEPGQVREEERQSRDPTPSPEDKEGSKEAPPRKGLAKQQKRSQKRKGTKLFYEWNNGSSRSDESDAGLSDPEKGKTTSA